MQRTQIRDVLRGIVESETDTTLGEFKDEMVLAQEFALDSVDFVSLIMVVEETFHIRMSNEELSNATTIGLLVTLVHSKIADLERSETQRRAA